MAMDLMKLREEERIKEKNRAINLSRREYYASMAMQGMLSNTGFTDCYNTETLAQASVEYADALIKELNKKE